MSNPFVSFIFSARNDDHCESFMRRFQNSLNVLRETAASYQLDHEIIIVQWNPFTNLPGLEDVLVFDEKITSPVRIITVPVELHDNVSATPFDAPRGNEITFFQHIAINAGARRAKGEYIVCTNADIIFNEELLSFLSKQQLSKKNFYRIYRYDVQREIDKGMPVRKIMGFCRDNSVMRGEEVEANRLHRKAAGDFLLMAKSSFEKIRGYAEIKCDGLKVDSDILDSARRYFKQVILEEPMRIYHQHHVNRYAKAYDKSLHVRKGYREVYKQTRGLVDKIIIKFYKSRRNPNRSDWGLVNQALSEVIAQ